MDALRAFLGSSRSGNWFYMPSGSIYKHLHKTLEYFFIVRNCKFLFYFKKNLEYSSSQYDFPVYNCMLFGRQRDLFHFYIILLVNQKIS